MENILQARGLKKYYGKGETQVRALDGVNLDIERGKFTAIIGTSGSGKSTLLRLLRGEQWPDQIDHRRAGRVLWHGPEGADPSPLTGRKVTSLVSAMQQERVVHQEWRVDGERLVLGGFPTRSTSRSSPRPKCARRRISWCASLAACIF